MTIAKFVDKLPPGIDWIVSIDSGASSGWAIARKIAPYERWSIVECGLLAPTKGERALAPWVPLVVVEVPQWQRGDTPKRINDLFKTTFRGAMLAEASGCPMCWCVHPHAWKGSVPKQIHIERIRDRLTLAELAVLANAKHPDGSKINPGLLHNTLDAIGLALWATGRR